MSLRDDASSPHSCPEFDWRPFVLEGEQRLVPRPLGSPGNAGIGDRLRAAAFAERQAEFAFHWAAQTFNDAPIELKECWLKLAEEEKKHCGWFLQRLNELEIEIAERPVHDALLRSFLKCTSAAEFCHLMAGAEERGRQAGERIAKHLALKDPITADIFRKIAAEEVAHIEAAFRFFPAS